MYGDQVGGRYEHIGKTTTENDCANLVRSTKPKANGASFYIGGTQTYSKNCYANFGSATGRNDDRDFRTCIFPGQ